MDFLTLRLSPDGRQAAVGSDQGEVQLFDVATGRPGPVLRGHAGAVESLEYSPDGRQLGSGARDGTIRLWDPATGRQQFVLRGEGKGTPDLHYRSDGKRIASLEALTEAGKVKCRLWDATTGQQLAILGESPATGSWQVLTISSRRQACGRLGREIHPHVRCGHGPPALRPGPSRVAGR